MFNPEFKATCLEDYLDQFFPDCTLCNDTDYWEDGRLCICNDEAYSIEIKDLILEAKDDMNIDWHIQEYGWG